MKSEVKRSNILNIAWIGQGDFGDEAMAFALRKYLQSLGINKITYYHHGKYPAYRTAHDLKINYLHSFNSKGIKKKIFDKFFLQKYNALIIGGGSILHSYPSIKWKLDIIRQLKKANFSFVSMAVGVSLGPFEYQGAVDICTQFLNEIDLALFRDNYSADLAYQLSTNPNLHASLDTSLLLLDQTPKEFEHQESRDSKKVGLMLVKNKQKQERFDEQEHFQKYLDIINHITAQDKKVVLFTFYIGEAYPDKKLNIKLKKYAKNPEMIEFHNFNGDIYHTVKAMNQCSYMLSMRLHGIIFAYMLSLPFVSLGYDPKNMNFCKSINYPDNLYHEFNSLKSITPVLNSLDFIFEHKKQVFENVMPIEKSVEKVKNNFNKVAKILKQKL
ncbi:MAG: polysaccharide pyruvyl transferase family protein [Candidatus Kuenenbacteria bacterium]